MANFTLCDQIFEKKIQYSVEEQPIQFLGYANHIYFYTFQLDFMKGEIIISLQ